MAKKVFFIIISSIALFLVVASLNKKSLSFIVGADTDGGDNVFLIDNNGDRLHVYRFDENGLMTKDISSARYSGYNYFKLNLMRPLDGETVFVYESEINSLNYRLESETIYVYDFKNGDRTAVYARIGGERYVESIVDMYAYGDKLYFAEIADDTDEYVTIDIKSVSAADGERAQTVRSFTYDSSVGISGVYISPSMEIVFSNPLSEIFCVQEGNKIKRIYPGEDGEGHKISAFTGDAFGFVYYNDVSDGTWRHSSVNTFSNAENVSFEPLRGDFSRYDGSGGVRFIDSDVFVYTSVGENNMPYAVFNNKGALTVIDRITESSPAVYYIYFFISLAAVMVVWLLAELIKGKKILIVIKQVSVFVPIVVLGIILLFYYTSDSFTRSREKSEVERLYSTAKLKIDSLDISAVKNIDWENPTDSIFYNTLKDKIYFSSSEEKVKNFLNGPEGSPEKIHEYSYYWLYTVKDNEIYTAFCDQNYVAIPLRYIHGSAIRASFQSVLTDKTSVVDSFEDTSGSWIVLLTPVMDENGDIIAIMETGTTKYLYTYESQQSAFNIAKIYFYVGLGMILALIVMLAFSLSPLGSLKRAVLSLQAGNWDARADIKTNDEISDIGGAFNEMADYIKKTMTELSGLNGAYFRFVPSTIFSMLGKDDALYVQRGLHTTIDLTIMDMAANDFEAISRNMTSKEVFDYLNEVYEHLAPKAVENGGVIANFSDCGFLALYKDDSLKSFISAMAMCEQARLHNEKHQDGTPIDVSAAIDKGSVMVGIVGYKDRLHPAVFSDHVSVAGMLREAAPKYGCRVIATESAVGGMSKNGDMLNRRFLGYLFMRNEDTYIKIYDFFDGDPYEIRTAKLNTKEQFEKGVRLFVEKDYYEARKIFIGCLKDFYNDKAAKEYLYLCDEYLRNPETGRRELEVF